MRGLRDQCEGSETPGSEMRSGVPTSSFGTSSFLLKLVCRFTWQLHREECFVTIHVCGTRRAEQVTQKRHTLKLTAAGDGGTADVVHEALDVVPVHVDTTSITHPRASVRLPRAASPRRQRAGDGGGGKRGERLRPRRPKQASLDGLPRPLWVFFSPLSPRPSLWSKTRKRCTATASLPGRGAHGRQGRPFAPRPGAG